ncbi:MAG: hypothetical protein M3364_09350 [Actinomycetota bacterium]|nr:hypothetical protein [Actinomycetota bacterium]
MKTVMLVAGVCLLAAAGSAGAQGTQTPRPQLAVTDSRPFEVRGVGFEPGERVQVLLVVNGAQRWERAVASSAGVFTVEFRVRVGACSRFTIRAHGSKGSTARIVPLRRHFLDCDTPN